MMQSEVVAQRCSVEKVLLEISQNLQEMPVPESLFNKVAGSSTLLKRGLWYRCFSVTFVKFLRTPFFLEHLWWLFLYNVLDHESYHCQVSWT